MVKHWGAILCIFTGVSLLMIAFIMLVVAPEYSYFIYSVSAVGFVSLFLFMTILRKELKTFMQSNFFKQLTSSFFTLFLVGCIFSLLNFIIYKKDLTLDFTKNKIHSLSSQSLKALDLIQPGEKLILRLFSKREEWGKYRELLKLYKAQKRDEIDLRFIDVETEPALTELFKIKESGTLVVEYKKTKYATMAKDELAVTNILLKILNPKKTILYYTVGHNEVSFMDKNLLGADYLREKILSSNYKLKPLELQNGVPKDCNAILIMNPQIEFLPSEIENLKAYLDKGGALVFLLSPQFNGLITKNFLKFIQSLGVTYNNALILDRLATQQGSQPSIPVVQSYNLEHPVTKKMENRTLFPVSGFFSFNESNNFSWDILIKSTPFPASWGEVNFDEVKEGNATFNELTDYKGPLNIMVAGSNEVSRVIGISSSQFIANQFQGQTPNFNLFLNALNWVVKDEALISLDRPKLSGEIVYISDIHASLVFYFSVLFFPFVFFIIGILVYRRKLRL